MTQNIVSSRLPVFRLPLGADVGTVRVNVAPMRSTYPLPSVASPGGVGGGFDYQAVFGSNPWNEAARKISELIAGQANPRGTSWETHVARPEDSVVQDYMAHILGGQRATLDDYVRRAAGAGIKRGGLNVRGGPALDAALHHTAMGSLVRGYADRLREAMNYNKYFQGTLTDQYNDSIRNLQNLLGIQHRYLSSEADWQSRLAGLMHDDWQREQDRQRQEPFRQMELDRMKRQAETERWRNAAERQDRLAEINRQAELANRWRDLMVKSSSPWGRTMTPAELLDAERTLVTLGTWKPLERKMLMKR